MLSSTTKPRILIVEDDPDTLALLAQVLEQAGYEVLKAEHALAAIASIVRRVPNLIVADIHMPIIDGFALVKELKTNSDTARIPVVVISGMNTPEYREAAFEAGCAAFIGKPLDSSAFTAQIEELLKQAMIRTTSESQT